MEVGPKGLLQTLADILKLIQKEDIVADSNNKFIFKLAPFVIFISVLVGFAVVPIGPGAIASNINTGVYFLLAILALDIIGFILAAWGSNNKFAIVSGMRTVAQMISYEIPLGFVVLGMVMFTQTMNLGEMTEMQGLNTTETLFGWDISQVGGFFSWNIVRFPFSILGFIIFVIVALGEANRAPFDHTEAESEVIGGLLTEYSGFRFSVIALAEYVMILLMGFLGAVLFFGGYHSPLPNIGSVTLFDWTSGVEGSFSGYAWAYFWLVFKAVIWTCITMWIRWTYPRVRIDQMMHTCWKVLIPGSLLFVLISGVFKLIQVS